MTVRDVVRVVLPTQFGEFDVTAFEVRPGLVYLALARGDLTDGRRRADPAALRVPDRRRARPPCAATAASSSASR